MQDHDLAAEVFQRSGTSIGLLERELGRILAYRLEVLLAIHELALQLFERAGERCRRERYGEDSADSSKVQVPHLRCR
jgi:hypothetical protein